MSAHTHLVILLAVAACSSPAPRPTTPPPTPARPVATPPPAKVSGLPLARPVATDRFPGVVACVRCHTAGDHGQMRDTAGADISPVTDANGAMMALAARDPYFLAAFRRELAAAPASAAAIEDLCVRCHAPVGYAEAKATGGTLTLDDLVATDTPAAALGREGVGCAGCHAMAPDGLGDEATLVGRAPLRTDRVAYGLQPEPLADAMVAMIKTTPIPSPHIGKSELCASCHTVVVRALDAAGHETGDEVAEQATFLEWRSSGFAVPGAGAKTCQDCHQALVATPTPFSTRPVAAPARDGYRRHSIRGGSTYLLSRLAASTDWLHAAATSAQLTEAAQDTTAFLTSAARLELAPTGSGLAVTVVNLTGHKLPTGFPTRRMWLHVTARDAQGQPLLESGAHVHGAIVGAGGKRLDAPLAILPHVDRITSADDACVWEAVPVDAAGARTHLLLGTARFVKDDRILPAGYRAAKAGSDASRTRPIGTAGDKTFQPGHDTVTVMLPAGTVTVDAELLFQAIPPETLESYTARDSREAAAFLAITAAPPEPQVLARAHWAR